MNRDYRFTLHVDCPDGSQNSAAFTVEAYAWPQLEPVDVCDRPITAMMVGGVTTSQAYRIDTDRQALADTISKALTTRIMESIKARDLRNGYKQP